MRPNLCCWLSYLCKLYIPPRKWSETDRYFCVWLCHHTPVSQGQLEFPPVVLAEWCWCSGQSEFMTLWMLPHCCTLCSTIYSHRHLWIHSPGDSTWCVWYFVIKTMHLDNCFCLLSMVMRPFFIFLLSHYKAMIWVVHLYLSNYPFSVHKIEVKLFSNKPI